MKIKYILLAAILSFSGLTHAARGIGEGAEPITPDSKVLMSAVITIDVDDATSVVDATCAMPVGILDVVVEDDLGMVHYKKKVNTSRMSRMSVDTRMFPKGAYIIKFVNSEKKLETKRKFTVK